jgi:uncharacterized membrane protein
MRKIFVVLFAFLGFVSACGAQVNTEEAIISFTSEITVNTDNSIDVTEVIVYDSGSIERHGIYRDIYRYSSTGRKIDIENVSVDDSAGGSHMFEVTSSGDYVRIKIGDPDKTFTGSNTYRIKYRAVKAIGQLDNVDELYWNVTGNGWAMPIYKAEAVVSLPNGAKSTQSACYVGLAGSTDRCEVSEEPDGVYVFNTPRALQQYEGITIAAGFPKGIVEPYGTSDKISDFFDKYLMWIIALLLPTFTLYFSLRHWYKKGRDPKGTGVIVPQYDVPDGLTPMEVAGIVNQKIKPSDISAEIVYLATKGYLKITQVENKTLGIFKSTNYTLTKLKDFDDLQNEFDKELLEALFESKESIKLSDLKNVFYKKIGDITKKVAEGLLSKGYYKNLGRMKGSGGRTAIIIFMAVWAGVFFGGIIGAIFSRGNPLVLIAGIFLSIAIYGIVSYFFPAKTEKGVAAKEYILGLKNYLRIAEKDRINFHNAPEKKPEIFEKLLPFAMVLGVEKAWAKEFEGIYTTPPSWYSGTSMHAFSATSFSDSLSSFNSYASSSMASSPGGGSGGGGSSGGGGGGGGGGGW